MRAFERLEGESAKAYAAWSVFRDLGSERSLMKACELYYGSTANVRQLSRWSVQFGWQERARAFDDWKAMLVQHAIAEKEREQAKDIAVREAKLRSAVLEVRELAAQKVRVMLSWPLVEEVVHRDVDGREVEVHYHPTRWSLATVPSLVAIMRGRDGEDASGEPPAEIDLSEFSEAEIQLLLELEKKVRFRRPE